MSTMNKENTIIRETIKQVDLTSAYRYLGVHNDLRVNGRRRAFKSFDDRQFWKRVLCRINAKGVGGWKLFETKCNTGHCTARFGITKHTSK